MAKESVAVVGAGLMGVGIAQVFALAGHEVTLQDVNAEALGRAGEAVRANLAFLAERGLGSAAEIEPAVARIRTATGLADAVRGVEVVRTAAVADDVVEKTMTLLRSVGKHPIDCKKDVPGFVANRLQHALWREAISIVEHGIADAPTVDESIRFGPGLRLPILAPMENADMVGLDLTLAIHSYILPHLEASGEPSPLLREKVTAGDLGFKTGKGFQTWSHDEAEASRRHLVEYLVHVLADPQSGVSGLAH